MNWVQINIQVNDDFRYMKIHIFALRWRDEIKRSSQLRTLLKRVVENKTIQEFHISKIIIHHLDGLFEPNTLTSSQLAC